MDLTGIMNNTKWEEIRLAMYGLGELSPKWRTRDLQTGYISSWDREWFYHFREGGYETIEWLEIEASSGEQRTGVLNALRRIHVPGEDLGGVFRIFGYVLTGASLEYL